MNGRGFGLLAGSVPGVSLVGLDPPADGLAQSFTLLLGVLSRKMDDEGRCCMIQLRREWGRFSNFSFRTPQRRISAYPARPSG